MADIFKVDPKTIVDHGQTYDATFAFGAGTSVGYRR
jgi:hypothetical protein